MPANTKFQIRRTSVAGRTPNTTGSYATNSQYIAAGEFALNMTDQILYTSDGTNLLTVGANQVNQNVSGNLSLTTNNKRFNFTPLAGGANVYFIQQNDDNFVFYSTNTINQPRAIWSVFGNSITSNLNFNVRASFGSGLSIPSGVTLLDSTGSQGSINQVLTSNGSGNVYWSSPSAVSVDQTAQYNWTNVHTFAANVNFDSNTLFINATNNRVGISNGAPDASLTVTGTANVSGNVVIGGSATITNSLFISNVYSNGTAYISNGFYVVAGNWGTVSANITLNSSNGNYQYLTSNAAYTITAPTQDCAIDILLTNGSGAGTITFSGFTVGSSTGSAYATTNNNKYILSVRRINSISTYSWYALQ